MKAIIMAGGKGSRIQSVESSVPKPMIRINGKPILQQQIAGLKNSGITDITLVTGYLGHFINEYFGDGSAFGVHISYYNETVPLGTAGALFKIPGLTQDFLLLCGDTIFDIDFKRFIAFHKAHGGLATLMSHPNSHPYDSSLLVTQTVYPDLTLPQGERTGEMPVNTCRVVKWLNKEDERLWYANRVNAGIEIISPELLALSKGNGHPTDDGSGTKYDLDRDILKPAVASGRIFAYDTTEYIKDMGTPDRYYQVEKDLQNGLVASRNLARKQKAFFLDRDGTINKSAGFLTDIDDMELLPGAAKAIQLINNSGYLAVLVTNQPQIARGELTFEELDEIHKKLETLLGREGAYLDALYFCPHHPDKGFDGERGEYKTECSCRKPAPGMLLKAAEDYNIDLAASYMIGDSARDEQAGIKAGCKKSVRLADGKSLYDTVCKLLKEQ